MAIIFTHLAGVKRSRFALFWSSGKVKFCPWQIVCMCDILLKRCKRLPLSIVFFSTMEQLWVAFRFSLSGQMWEPSITLSVLTKQLRCSFEGSLQSNLYCWKQNRPARTFCNTDVIWALIQYISLYTYWMSLIETKAAELWPEAYFCTNTWYLSPYVTLWIVI